MRDEDFDDILNQAAGTRPELDPALLARLSQSVSTNLQPVRQLPSPWILGSALTLLCAVAAGGGGLLLGPHGVHAMAASQLVLILAVLVILVGLAAWLAVAEVIPGSRLPAAPSRLIFTHCIALGAVFALLFHSYGTARYVIEGIKCLVAGVAIAVPSAAGVLWILRRGAFLDRTAAGISVGTLAGLVGIGMLELHCPNLELPHMVVWHIAVVPLCGIAAGYLMRKMGSF